jgi:hypothetical protein
MSCCGKKRNHLKQEITGAHNGSSFVAHSERMTGGSRETRVFEYTGTGYLYLKGVATGKVYRFEHHGASVQVAYEDSFAMRAESGLIMAG